MISTSAVAIWNPCQLLALLEGVARCYGTLLVAFPRHLTVPLTAYYSRLKVKSPEEVTFYRQLADSACHSAGSGLASSAALARAVLGHHPGVHGSSRLNNMALALRDKRLTHFMEHWGRLRHAAQRLRVRINQEVKAAAEEREKSADQMIPLSELPLTVAEVAARNQAARLKAALKAPAAVGSDDRVAGAVVVAADGEEEEVAVESFEGPPPQSQDVV